VLTVSPLKILGSIPIDARLVREVFVADVSIRCSKERNALRKIDFLIFYGRILSKERMCVPYV